jgi:hypothetical protein
VVDSTGSRPVNLETTARLALLPNQKFLVVPSRAELLIAARLVAIDAAHEDTCVLARGAWHAAWGKIIRGHEFCVLRQTDTTGAATADGCAICHQEDAVRPKSVDELPLRLWAKERWRAPELLGTTLGAGVAVAGVAVGVVVAAVNRKCDPPAHVWVSRVDPRCQRIAWKIHGAMAIVPGLRAEECFHWSPVKQRIVGRDREYGPQLPRGERECRAIMDDHAAGIVEVMLRTVVGPVDQILHVDARHSKPHTVYIWLILHVGVCV